MFRTADFVLKQSGQFVCPIIDEKLVQSDSTSKIIRKMLSSSLSYQYRTDRENTYSLWLFSVCLQAQPLV
jgi:hypothetical protein